MVDSSAAIGWCAMFTDMLDTPVSKLAMCNDINIAQYFLDARSLSGCQYYDTDMAQGVTDLVFLEAVLKYVLNDEAACFTQSNLVPHTTECFIHIFHDLRWRLSPSEFEELLPNVTGIAMNNGLGNAT